MKKTLGETCEFYAGTGFPNEYQGEKTGEYPFYKVGDISKTVQSGHIWLNQAENYISDDVVKIIKGKIVPEKTVVFAKIGEALKLNRRAITTCDSLIDNNTIGIKPDAKWFITEYFFYYMRSLKMQNYAESTTVPSVRKSNLERIEVFIPSIEEQELMVKRLSSIENIINKQKIQINSLDELIKSRFVEMFGDLKVNDKGWEIVGFKDCADIDTKMIHDFCGYEDYPHIGIDSIEKETGKLVGYRTIAEDGIVSGKYLFTSRHIIYSKIRPNLNKVALPVFDGLCSADAYPILVKEGICNREYFGYTLRSDYFLEYILAFSDRTNLPKVNKKQVEGFNLPLPPIELQNQFAGFVEHIDKLKVKVQQSLNETQLMFDSLMQKYFG